MTIVLKSYICDFKEVKMNRTIAYGDINITYTNRMIR